MSSEHSLFPSSLISSMTPDSIILHIGIFKISAIQYQNRLDIFELTYKHLNNIIIKKYKDRYYVLGHTRGQKNLSIKNLYPLTERETDMVIAIGISI